VLTFDYTVTFEDKNVGTNKTVNFTSITVSGGVDEGNYTLLTTSGTAQADIVPRTLMLTSFVAGSKIYDGTMAVTSGDEFDDDRVAGDELTFDYTAAFEDKNVGTNKTVNFTSISISGGVDAGNYTLAPTTGVSTADIMSRNLTLTSFVAGSKTYDGTMAVTSGDGFADDRVVGDVLTFAYTVAFEDAAVGTNKTVSFTSITVSGGVDAGNYTLLTTSGAAQADIAPRTLVLTSFVAGSKIYDGTMAVMSGDEFDDDRVAGDELTFDYTVAFEGKNVGMNKTVNFTSIAISGGGGADNYTLASTTGTATADITELLITIVPDVDQGKTAGEDDPGFTYISTPALLGGDVITGLMSREDAGGNSAGSFTFTFGTLTAGLNYELVMAVSAEKFVVVVGDASCLTLETPDTQVAGELQVITVTACDAFGNIDSTYEGLKRTRFSGATPSLLPVEEPKIVEDELLGGEEIPFGDMTFLWFESGLASAQSILSRAEVAEIEIFAADNNSDYNNDVGLRTMDTVAVTVLAADAEKLFWVTQPQTNVDFGVTLDAFSIEIADAWGNRTDEEFEVTVTPSIGAFNGTNPQLAVNGLAVFDDLVCDSSGTITLIAMATNLTASPESDPIIVGARPIVVTFDAQGGESVELPSIEAMFGETYGTLASATYEGYLFRGWFTEPNLGGERIFATTIVNITEDHTLYAGWDSIAPPPDAPTITIAVNQNSIEVTFAPSVAGYVYFLEFTEDLSGGWLKVGDSVEGPVDTLTHQGVDSQSGFYRVAREPVE